MPRFKLWIEYDGTPYCGWQRQENGPSVQGALERAVLSLTGGLGPGFWRRAHGFRCACPRPGGAC